MTFFTALSVSTSIVRNWISQLTDGAKHSIYETPTFTQFLYTKDKETVLTINLVEQSHDHVTILFIYTSSKKHKSIQIKFEDGLKLNLPIDSITSEFRARFIHEISQEKDSIKELLKAPQNLQEGDNNEPEETNAKTAKLPSLGFTATREPQPNPSTTSSSGARQRPPDMPDFDDEYEMLPKHNQENVNRDIFPSIGDDDLNPPGIPKNPELTPFLDHRTGGRGSRGDGGMHPSLDHPLFRRGDIRGSNSGGIPGVPPGARYDDPLGGGGIGGDGFDGPAGPQPFGHFGPPKHGRNQGGPPGGFGGGPGGGFGGSGGGFNGSPF